MKRQGVKAGVCDNFLPVARHGWFGLYVELKYRGNKPSPKQIEFIEFVTKQGYLAVVCWSWSEAAEVIKEYLT